LEPGPHSRDDSRRTDQPIRIGGTVLRTHRHICGFFNNSDRRSLIEQNQQLKNVLGSEGRARIFLDLKEVTLVDRAAVQFLARVETEGVRILNCPDYVRSWIVAESGGTQT
jgi:hypothetical protein